MLQCPYNEVMKDVERLIGIRISRKGKVFKRFSKPNVIKRRLPKA